MTNLELISVIADCIVIGCTALFILCIPVAIVCSFINNRREEVAMAKAAEQDDESGEDIDELIDDYNKLVDKYDRLLEKHVDLENEFNLSVTRNKNLTEKLRKKDDMLTASQKKIKRLQADYDDLSRDFIELEKKANEK